MLNNVNCLTEGVKMDNFDKGQQAGTFNGTANKCKTAKEIADNLGHVEMVNLFIAHGVDVNNKGETAKEMADRLGHVEVVKFLLASGSDGKTALKIAEEKGARRLP